VKRPIGISTWVWESPLTDANLGGHLARIAALGLPEVITSFPSDPFFFAIAAPPAVRFTPS